MADSSWNTLYIDKKVPDAVAFFLPSEINNNLSENRFRSSLSCGASFKSFDLYAEDFHRIFLLSRKVLFRQICSYVYGTLTRKCKKFWFKNNIRKYFKILSKVPWNVLLKIVSQSEFSYCQEQFYPRCHTMLSRLFKSLRSQALCVLATHHYHSWLATKLFIINEYV